ncbi:Mitochondrial tRNA-specific 2-thiouridylase 1 [Nymphon striatum]|nr:Mitochondrial tRNA-specific 2-thiouridylase 1 [Nymphon striatum]
MLPHVRRIVCGISGGVDSCVSALLLKNKGYEVIGAFMRNWDQENESGQCSIDDDYKDAEWVCRQLKIPFYEVNLVKEYWNEVFTEFLNNYEVGITLNPDVLCNKNIKFGHFYNKVMEKFQADAVCMGHYAQISHHEKPIRGTKLLQPVDKRKDQTLFLCQVPQQSLQNFIFPIGHLYKDQVKEIAMQAGFHRITKKKESMGICFIGKRNFQKFIDEYVPSRHGNFVDIDSRCIVGHHQGIHHFTIGQRCGISGPHAYFVAKFNVDTQEILVASDHDHPSLYSDLIHTFKPYWIYSEPEEFKYEGNFNCWFRTQSRSPIMECEIVKDKDGIMVKLPKPNRAIAPGQFIVFYKDGECLGSAQISHANMKSDDDLIAKEIIGHKS